MALQQQRLHRAEVLSIEVDLDAIVCKLPAMHEQPQCSIFANRIAEAAMKDGGIVEYERSLGLLLPATRLIPFGALELVQDAAGLATCALPSDDGGDMGTMNDEGAKAEPAAGPEAAGQGCGDGFAGGGRGSGHRQVDVEGAKARNQLLRLESDAVGEVDDLVPWRSHSGLLPSRVGQRDREYSGRRVVTSAQPGCGSAAIRRVGALLVPSAFERALAEIDNVAGLKQVYDQLEAVGKLAKKMALALEDQNRIAELRIRAARKAGTILARTVKRGGNSQGGSSAPLPEGISWNQSSRWQALAKLPEQTLTRYLAAALEAQEEVTVSGFLRASKAKDLAVHFSSERAEWLTPPELIEAVVDVLGGIDLDPCSDNQRSVPARRHFTAAEDGLSQEWHGRVYMNPPYGSAIESWVAKLQSAFEDGAVSEAIALLPSRTDTAWFCLLRSYPRCFITGRLTFSGCESPAPFPSVVVYLGKQVSKFVRRFSDSGDCYALLPAPASTHSAAA